jgi:hypothetical protein
VDDHNVIDRVASIDGRSRRDLPVADAKYRLSLLRFAQPMTKNRERIVVNKDRPWYTTPPVRPDGGALAACAKLGHQGCDAASARETRRRSW